MAFHGSISGHEAVSRLKATKEDCYLIRYSDNQSKYLLCVLEVGLGQDLVKEFEILIVNDGKRCKINGSKEEFKTLDDMLSHYESMPIHLSVMSLGESCPSPRHRQRKAKHDLTESYISQMSSTEMFKRFSQQQEQIEKTLKELQQVVEKKRCCTIL